MKTASVSSFPIRLVNDPFSNHQCLKQVHSTKKQVVLGELTNTGNYIESKELSKGCGGEECAKSEVLVMFGSIQENKLYAPLMYQHLHSLEKDLIKILDFEISYPTSKTFLGILIRAAQGDNTRSCSNFEFLSWFLVELSLLDCACLKFLPSMVAASAIFIAKFTLEPEKYPWGLKLQRCSGYKPSELKDCVLAIHDLQLSRRVSSSKAVREKYSQHKFKCVAALPCPSEILASYFEDADE